jgi:hypothetical protein
MKTSMYGQISLTKLWAITQQQKDLVKEVTFKDGHKEKFLNISILVNEQPNQYGKIGAVRVDCKRDQQQKNINYWIADLKPSQFQDQQPAQQGNWEAPLPHLGQEEESDLPF